MEKTVLIAATIKSYKPRLFDAISPYALLEKVEKRYKFKSAPTYEQIAKDEKGPFNFVYGTFQAGDRVLTIEQFVIQYVGVYTTTVAASIKTDTDDVDLFLSEIEQMAHQEFKVDTTKVNPDYHNSVLEVKFDKPISAYFAQLDKLVQRLKNKVEEYGFRNRNFEVAGFSVQVDSTNQQLPQLGSFTLERRAGAPFSENRYFSQAPLRTADH